MKLKRIHISKRNIRLGLLGLFFVVTGALAPLAINQPGLDSAAAIGAFINDSLPRYTPLGSTGWEIEPAFPNLTFDDPLTLLQAPNTSDMYLGTRDGRIYKFLNDSATTTKDLVLDIRHEVAVVWDGGFLGIAFHPEFNVAGSANRRHMFVYYTARDSGVSYASGPTNGYFNVHLRLSRFTIPDGVDTVDLSSELVMINVRLYNSSHRGGGLAFGADSMLHVSMGDNFRYGTAQDIVNTLEGGVMRLDVEIDSTKSHAPLRTIPADVGYPEEISGIGYYIPDDNPFVDSTGAVMEEYFALGNRNPHRLTYDAITDRFWSGEIGENKREEINIIQSGGNYGWPFREGKLPGPQPPPASYLGTLQEPIIDFLRTEANSIIGGYVYRGSKFPTLQGKYICGDYAQNRIWALNYVDSTGLGLAEKELLTIYTPGSLTTFGVDASGELYMMGLGTSSQLYKLKALGYAEEAPALLSQTGIFSDISTMTPVSGVIPYDLNTPFWSDSARKFRWMAIPNNGTHNIASEQLGFSETEPWTAPSGSVFIKHFEIGTDETDPSQVRKLETRLIVRTDDDKFYGLSYRWRPDQSDADLLPGSWIDTLSITTSTGTREQKWLYPDRSDCMFCHNAASGSLLGPKTWQFNGQIYYPVTGRTANQLYTLDSINIFKPSFNPGDTATFLKSVAITDTSASLEARVRSWLDSNCSNCHRPGTGNRGIFDARFPTPLFAQQYIFGDLSHDEGIAGSKVIYPQDTFKSMIYQRVKSLDPHMMMPPLAKERVDTFALKVIGEWIMSLDSNSYSFGEGLTATYYSDRDTSIAEFQRVDETVDFNWGTGSPFPTIPDDDFSVIWEGEIQPIYEETYTFRVDVSDGVRLWVDNQLVIDAWNLGTYIRSGTISLQSGIKIPIRLEYFEYVVDAKARFFWSSQTQVEEVVPTRYLFPKPGKVDQAIDFPEIGPRKTNEAPFALPAQLTSQLPINYSVVSGPASVSGTTLTLSGAEGVVIVAANHSGNDLYNPALEARDTFEVFLPQNFGNGLLASYFDEMDFTVPKLNRTDPNIDFDWAYDSPDTTIDKNKFSVRWEGQFRPTQSEEITFRTYSSDGVRLWVDDSLLIDQWVEQATPTSHTAKILLTSGQKVNFKMEYYEYFNVAVAKLYWSSPTIFEEIVPQVRFFAQTSSLPVDWLSFKALADPDGVQLEWVVATEVNNDFFTVERSADGRKYESISKVPSLGDYLEARSYQVTDKEVKSGVWYYRIRQTDMDGQFSYTQVERVNLQALSLSVFPNPVSRNEPLWIAFDQPDFRRASLELYDMRGSLVRNKAIDGNGSNSLVEISLNELPVGIYTLRIEVDGVLDWRKVLIK